MAVLVTGAAGFIGYHVSAALLARGERVVGFDSVNHYYDPALKEARLAGLAQHAAFRMVRADLATPGAFVEALAGEPGIERVIHLAAQAGVRHSLDHPEQYVAANLVGHFNVIEACRRRGVRHLVYASSSSVYGGNARMPSSVEDKVDRPVSFYAATKAANELMSHSYAQLWGLAQTGLRFFTVYGPWGRPDMSAYLFASAIAAGRPIALFNHGDMKRDFTYVDDIVAGVLAALDRPPADDGRGGAAPHRIYNLGNRRSEELRRFVALLEQALGRRAVIELKPMQAGDVKESCADIESATRDLGYRPTTPIEVGIPKFVAWFRDYHKI